MYIYTILYPFPSLPFHSHKKRMSCFFSFILVCSLFSFQTSPFTFQLSIYISDFHMSNVSDFHNVPLSWHVPMMMLKKNWLCNYPHHRVAESTLHPGQQWYHLTNGMAIYYTFLEILLPTTTCPIQTYVLLSASNISCASLVTPTPILATRCRIFFTPLDSRASNRLVST